MQHHATAANAPRHLLRVAKQLLGKLKPSARGSAYGLSKGIHQFQHRYALLQRTWRLFTEAERRGWSSAAGRLRSELSREAVQVRDQAATLARDFANADLAPPPIPSDVLLRTLLGELQQLSEEFDVVEFDLKHHVITAQTGSIELQGLALGPFRVELRLDQLGSSPGDLAFRCVALEPNAASANEDVTHPHVKGERLCAGEATLPIAPALSQGRICDAFCLIRAVLNEYNPHSPYVSIDDWNGVRCMDCDSLTDRDELYYCEHCGHDVCNDCYGGCELCDHSCCRGCLEQDADSGRYCCPNCRHTCQDCGRTVDADHFHSDSDLCPQCHQQQEEESEPIEETPHHEESEHPVPVPATLPVSP